MFSVTSLHQFFFPLQQLIYSRSVWMYLFSLAYLRSVSVLWVYVLLISLHALLTATSVTVDPVTCVTEVSKSTLILCATICNPLSLGLSVFFLSFYQFRLKSSLIALFATPPLYSATTCHQSGRIHCTNNSLSPVASKTIYSICKAISNIQNIFLEMFQPKNET